jgi:hypothetical protein
MVSFLELYPFRGRFDLFPAFRATLEFLAPAVEVSAGSVHPRFRLLAGHSIEHVRAVGAINVIMINMYFNF